MAELDLNKLEINLKNSINTDTIGEDFRSFDDMSAPLLANTGIERDGGVTNIYEKETTYPEAGQYVITESGKTISVVDSTVSNYKIIKIDGKPIGQASAYGVEKQLFVESVEDIFLDTASYTTASLIDNAIIVTEYDYDQVQLNTRTITFPNLVNVLAFFTSLSFVRYNGMKYSDSLEFALRLGDQVIILQESNPSISINRALQSSSALGTSGIACSIVYNNTLVVAGNAGRVASFDGTNWRNYDGTGTGIGIFNSGDATLGVIGSSDILSVCLYTYGSASYLVFGGVNGRIGNYNGTSWVIWSSGGVLTNNGTVISTDIVNCMTQAGEYLVVAGSVGKLGSWRGSTAAWTNYSGSGVCDNATLIGAVSINALCYYQDYEGNNTLVVAGASGRVGSMKIQGGVNWTFTTTTAPGNSWHSVAYGNGLWVAVAYTNSTTAGIATSPDGITWTFRTTTAPGGNWYSVTYGNGLWVAVAATVSTTAGIATSPDGITWTFRTTTAPGGSWSSVAYGNGLWVAVAVIISTTAGIATSPDGINWTFRTTTTPGGAWYSVAYGNGLWVAVAFTASTTAGIAVSKSDTSQKLIYTTASTPLYPTNNGTVIGANAINAMVQFQGQLVVGGAGGLVGSFGGYSWINYNQVGMEWKYNSNVILKISDLPGYFASAVYGNGLWVAVCSTTSTTAGIATSPDGINWTFRTTTAPGGTWSSIAYGNGLFVAVANTTSTTAGIATSPDGINWTFRTTSAPGGNWRSVAFGNSVFVAQCFSSTTNTGLAYSSNGSSWTFATTSAPASIWQDMTFGNGFFVAMVFTTSTTAGLAYSSNGSSWTFATTSAPAAAWARIRYANGLFFALANSTSTTAAMATSSNGTSWTFVTTPAPAGSWASVVYLNGVYTAISSISSTTAQFATSTNATSWSFISTVSSFAVSNAVSSLNMVLLFSVALTSNSSIYYFNNIAFSDNATLLGSNAINTFCPSGNVLAVGGIGGRIGSFDNLANKTVYTSGSGVANNATLIGSNNIWSIVVYNNQFVVSGNASAVNSMSSTGAFTPFYSDGGTVTANLLTGFNSLGYLYVYRYENGLYLVNLTGNSLNKAYTLDNSTKAISTINCRYAIPQVSNNLTRHIVSSSDTTARHIYDASNIKCTGLVGYTDFISFSGSVVYPPAVYTLGNGNVLQSQAGFGYSDFTFRLSTSATNIYNYIPQFQASTSGLYQIVQSNSNTLVNAYGKLNNNLNLTPSKPFEFRVGWTSGVQSYLSVALLDGVASDTLGTIITNVGEFDDTYTPMIEDDDKILYQYNNKFVVVKIGTSIDDRIQKIDTNIYKLNSISPLNIIDPFSSTLELGSIDYNNRMLFTSSAVPSVSTKVATYIQGKYSNSIDTGDKLVTIVSPTSANIDAIGYRIPVVSTSVGNYSVDTFINDIYSYSTLNDGSELVVSTRVNTVYVATTIIPTSLGVDYGLGTATVGGVTIFLKPSYDGYSIGNDITGTYTSFVLFGQNYIFDGNNIYAASIDEVNGIFNSKTLLCGAVGLQYIASSPTEIYFLSNFDNSIYTFSGGRNLNKFKRMNMMPKVNSGLFNVVDNTLLFDTDTSFIWVRDSVITENPKKATQTLLKYYSTKDGIVISNNTNNWKYTYSPLSGSTVVPLSIQTPYYGFNLNDKSILSAWVVTIYNENKDVMAVNGTSYTIDEDSSHVQTVNWNVNPVDYNDGGYVRLRMQPQFQRTLGTSLKLDTNSKVVLISVLPEFKKGEAAVVAKARSR